MKINLIHKRLTISSTILFLIGMYGSFERALNEYWVLFFGYLPTVGIVFTLSIASLSDNWKKFSFITIPFYCILHYLFMGKALGIKIEGININDLILPGIGALGTLAILKFSSYNLDLNWYNYIVAFFLGALTFIPRIFDNSIIAFTISIFLWQIIIGHYYNYLKAKNTLANHSYSA